MLQHASWLVLSAAGQVFALFSCCVFENSSTFTEQPAILISRLLLRMRRMYVAC